MFSLLQGLPALVLHEIQLLKDAHHTETEEEKISSSSLRSRLLGTLLTPLKVGHDHQLQSIIPVKRNSFSNVKEALHSLQACYSNCQLSVFSQLVRNSVFIQKTAAKHFVPRVKHTYRSLETLMFNCSRRRCLFQVKNNSFSSQQMPKCKVLSNETPT